MVGVSVGGHGVPLVFLHGLGLSGRAYVRLLSRLAGMGFLVVALDAAGHGGTPKLPRSAADLTHRVDLTVRTPFDDTIREPVRRRGAQCGRCWALPTTLTAIRCSCRRRAQSLPADDDVGPGAQCAYPLGLPAAFRAIIASGDALRASARAHGADGCVTCWADALLSDDSPLRPLADGPLDLVGTEASERVSLDRLRTGPCRAPNTQYRKGAGRFGRRRGRRRESVTA